MSSERLAVVLLALAGLLPVVSLAQDDCGQAPLKDEHEDAATVQVLERAWSIAFLQGDTDFERCLLTPDFTEITRGGAVKRLADEFAVAARNRGKDLPSAPPLKIQVMIHGDVAVAYVAVPHGEGGKTFSVYNADYYIWERGGWHAFFSQQSQF